jgi:hypothetical protein
MVSQCDMACDTGQTPMNQKVPNIGSVLSLTVSAGYNKIPLEA